MDSADELPPYFVDLGSYSHDSVSNAFLKGTVTLTDGNIPLLTLNPSSVAKKDTIPEFKPTETNKKPSLPDVKLKTYSRKKPANNISKSDSKECEIKNLQKNDANEEIIKKSEDFCDCHIVTKKKCESVPFINNVIKKKKPRFWERLLYKKSYFMKKGTFRESALIGKVYGLAVYILQRMLFKGKCTFRESAFYERYPFTSSQAELLKIVAASTRNAQCICKDKRNPKVHTRKCMKKNSTFVFRCQCCQWKCTFRRDKYYKVLLHLIHHPKQEVDEDLIDLSVLKKYNLF